MARPNRVVPRSLALAPDRGGSFLFLPASPLKGGGSVESDLSDLDMLSTYCQDKEMGIVEPTPVRV